MQGGLLTLMAMKPERGKEREREHEERGVGVMGKRERKRERERDRERERERERGCVDPPLPIGAPPVSRTLCPAHKSGLLCISALALWAREQKAALLRVCVHDVSIDRSIDRSINLHIHTHT